MKKVFAIACLLVVLVLAASAMVSAQQGAWRFYLKADDGTGSNSLGAMTIGVATTSKDGFGIDGTASDAQDLKGTLGTTTTPKGVFGVFNGVTWNRDIKSSRLPQDAAYDAGQPAPVGVYGSYPYEANRKFWDLRVVGMGTANAGQPIRLLFNTVSAAAGIPPTMIASPGSPGGVAPAAYWLRMVDNKGVEGAPANGTVWSIPVPAAHQTAAFFTLTLPTINVTIKDDAHIISEGYVMQFYQTPEPSSILALGAGLMGLVGFASRRRRS